MKSSETLKDLVMMSRGFSSKSDGYSKLKYAGTKIKLLMKYQSILMTLRILT